MKTQNPLDTIRPLAVIIEIADVTLTYENGKMTMADIIDKREETIVCTDTHEACAIIQAFLETSEPGKAFATAFPFWV